jgi:hypothetical protein
LWRRSKLGLVLKPEETERLARFMADAAAGRESIAGTP